MPAFATRIILWQQQHGRHELPWQGENAYRVWLSEIMLQQTQVATVIPYFHHFITSFPDISALAAASEEQVLAHWSGLGYYSRARNLHRAAQMIMHQHDGQFPEAYDEMLALPGIGRSTAAAISALAFHQHRAILDGNVKRVLARHIAVDGWTGDKKIETQLWDHAESVLPLNNIAAYTQGMMDLGAMICTRSKPRCSECPVRIDCVALQQGRVDKLPLPRPRKLVPEKNSTFLLLLSGADILLEKRPGSGIWGGLWCPPQFEDAAQALKYCEQQYGADAENSQAMPLFTHTFTHFKLHISPLRVQIKRPSFQLQQPGSQWFNVREALRAAIPAPVRKLLLQLDK